MGSNDCTVRCGAQVSYCSYPLDPGATGLLLLRIGGPKKRRGTDMSAAADSEITGAWQLITLPHHERSGASRSCIAVSVTLNIFNKSKTNRPRR